ncbi:MAG TPA: type III-A CRISPR-associated protein Cas10/Csm1, partial [Deltaproteobacteria bacterium]|nr:type III-A CRISPR-associated protein Cas10/Csm1 [Deltaproteobacteria bacterium]
LWEKLGKAAERKKFRKLRLDQTGAVKGYLDSFDNRLSVCPFCGKRPADPKTENDAYLSGNVACLICRDHIHFGTHLIKSDTMAIVSTESQYKGKGLKSPLFSKYQIVFDLGTEAGAELEKGGNLLAHVSLVRGGKILKKGLGVRYVSGYVPTYTEEDQYDNRYLHGKKGDKNLELIEMIKNGEPKSFHHMAKAALNSRMDCDDKFSGVEALGILKADVDHLGKLFACGLPDERLNLSRLATFSRQMDSFFSIYIPWLLSTDSRFRNIYTVFAGGDDLFLIGPWNRIIQFAEKLKKTFAHFCCENQAITISAGIIVSKPGVPVPNIAEQAEEALEEAKGNGRDSITLFGETAKWDVFAKQQNIRETIDAWQKNGSIGKGLLYQLNGLIAMAKKEKELVSSKKALELDDMSCLAWRSKLTYSATRNVGKNMGKTERQAAVEDVLAKLPGWLCEYDGKLKMALWQILYNQR